MARPAFALALLWLSSLAAPQMHAEAPPIRLTNCQEGTAIRHPYLLLRGELADRSAASLAVVNQSSRQPARELKGLAHQGRFLALAELVPGPNRLLLRSGKHELALTLNYKPQTNPHFVRAVYMTDSTGDTTYLTPHQKDPQDYAAKLDTALKLMQAFTAERMNCLGHGRCTFNLELDDKGRVKVHTLKGMQRAAHYYSLNDQAWWREVSREVNERFPGDKGKNVVIAAYTRLDPKTGKVQGHTALGGGNLALFGSGGLFSWPSSLDGVFRAFADERPVDGKRAHDDSAGRGVCWALASTTIGATLHEMGHTFGLPHSRDPRDIMTRGFDHFNRAFSLVEPPDRHNPRSREVKEEQAAYFAPVSAAALWPSRWFALDARPFRDRDGPQLSWDEAADSLLVEAPHGLRFVGIDSGGDAADFRTFRGTQDAPRRLKLSRRELEKWPLDTLTLRAIDAEGQAVSAPLSGLLKAHGFVRTWRFSRITKPWPRPDAFVSLDARQLKAIEVSAAAADPVVSKTAFVDFLPRFPAQTSNVAAYAIQTIQAGRERKVKILTGSDDALRIWVNGELVIQSLALRSAKPDQDSAAVGLRRGANTLLVEVSQARDGWGLYLRLEDEDGRKLRLTETGELKPLSAAGKGF